MSAVLEISKPEFSTDEVLYGVSWEMYAAMIAEYRDSQFPRLTYDSGILGIIMSNSLQHEEDSRNLAALFEQIAVELEIDFRRGGSTTFHEKSLSKGFEPDSCFYIQSLEKIAGKEDLDAGTDSPPDLIIEINKTSSSVPRMPIFAAFGVAEVWRLTKKQVKFYALRESVYLESKMSLALPILASEQATEFMLAARESSSTAWIKNIRNWTTSAKIDLGK